MPRLAQKLRLLNCDDIYSSRKYAKHEAARDLGSPEGGCAAINAIDVLACFPARDLIGQGMTVGA